MTPKRSGAKRPRQGKVEGNSVDPATGSILIGGTRPSAFVATDPCAGLGADHPLFLRLKGLKAQREGRVAAAIQAYESAVAAGAGDFQLLHALGVCLSNVGRPEDALTYLDAAINLDPSSVRAQFDRAWTLVNAGELKRARVAFEHVLILDPAHVGALGHLAALAKRAAEWSRTRLLANQALTPDPTSRMALTALAAADAADGRLAEAETRLRGLLGSSRIDHQQAITIYTLGDVLDQQGNADAAFRAYEDGAAMLRNVNVEALGAAEVESTLALVRRLDSAFAKADPGVWKRRPMSRTNGDPIQHLFLIGFPRSGTTMLGQALAGHPDVLTLDERITLADSIPVFLRPSAGALARLAALDPAGAEPFREGYWRRVRSYGIEPSGRVFIDKLPMNTPNLPLITRLFPQAKVLFLRRDPRDVVLSAFRRQFKVNLGMVDFLNLRDTAELYNAMMRLMESYGKILDMDLRVQVYEDLVVNFENETRNICAFLDIPWSSGMADFAGRAGDVATPSGAQLARGLNADGIGVWRRYRAQLKPVMPLLARWVQRFGYPAE